MPLSFEVSLASKHVFTVVLRALRSSANGRFTALLMGGALLAVLPAIQFTAPRHIEATLVASSSWLDHFNQWRSTSGLSNLTENTIWSSGDHNHAVYMVKTGQVTHYEVAGPYYTASGNAEAQNSNIFVSSSTNTTDTQAIDWWMGAPFHAMAMMDPRLTQTGFGSYRDTSTSPWQMGAALDVSSGNSYTGGTFPVYFPGNGSTEPLTAYSGNETPDPTSACPGYAGLPLFVEVGGNVNTTAGPVHTLMGNGTPLAHCIIDSTNPALSSYLKGRGGVIVFPQQPLQSGATYTVTLSVNLIPYTWSFTVGPLGTTPPPAGWSSLGGVLSSSPNASSAGATRTDIFIRGSDSALWHRSWNGVIWGGWESLGGVLGSGPSSVDLSANRVDVFIRGQEGGLWHRSWTGSWNNWESLGGVLNGSPTVVALGSNRLDVFIRGSDDALWTRTWDSANGWGGWSYLGGVVTSSPSAASAGAGRMDVFIRGTDNALWTRTWNSTAGWAGWRSLGGVLPADPLAIVSTGTRIDIFARGTDRALWQNGWNGSSWVGWTSHGGVMNSAPSAVSCASGHIDTFQIGTDSGIWQQGFNGAAWGAWQSIGGRWSGDLASVCRAGTLLIDLFARGTDGALWTGPATGS